MKSFVDSCRFIVSEREGDFLTTLIGTPALYQIPNSVMAQEVVDALAAHNPQLFVRSVGEWLSEVEVS